MSNARYAKAWFESHYKCANTLEPIYSVVIKALASRNNIRLIQRMYIAFNIDMLLLCNHNIPS